MFDLMYFSYVNIIETSFHAVLNKNVELLRLCRRVLGPLTNIVLVSHVVGSI